MTTSNRWCCILILVFVLSPALVAAQTLYVTEEFEITMRTGPSTGHKVIALLRSGQPLEMLERGEEWSRVRGPEDREGWVLNRYLSPRPPCSRVLERVRAERNRLDARLKDQQQNLQELRSESGQSEALLARLRQELDELSRSYETLQRESAQFLQLKNRFEEVSASYEAERARSAELQEENRELKRSRALQWVMTGGGIMLAGFFIGLFSARRRRPRSYLD